MEAVLERVRAIRDYEIPVVYMLDHSFDDAVDVAVPYSEARGSYALSRTAAGGRARRWGAS